MGRWRAPARWLQVGSGGTTLGRSRSLMAAALQVGGRGRAIVKEADIIRPVFYVPGERAEVDLQLPHLERLAQDPAHRLLAQETFALAVNAHVPSAVVDVHLA